MLKKSALAVLLLCQLYSAYGEGDQISIDDQNMEFNFCYPEDSTEGVFSLGKNSGKIILLDMVASW